MAVGELTINEEVISLKPNTVIALTFAVSDIADVANRQGNGSNSFQVPKTQGNIEKLGHIDKVSSLSDLPYRKLSARYVQKGIQIVKSGYAEISEVAEDFEIVLYDGNTPFFDLVDKKKLSDLDFSALDHVWDLATVWAYRPNTSGIIYTVVDTGYMPTWLPGSTIIRADKQLPWIFLHTVIEKIFEGTGYTFNGKFLLTSLYSNLILNFPTMKQDETMLLASASETGSQTYATTDLAEVIPMEFDTIVSDPLQAALPPGVLEIISPGFWGPYTQYNVLNPGIYSFTATINWTVLLTNATVFQIAILGMADTDYLSQSVIISGGGSGTFNLEAKGVPLEAGDKIVVRAIAGKLFGDPAGTVTINAGSTFACTEARATIVYGTWFPIAMNLPDLTQKDLIKAMMQMYCIIPMTNTLTKNVQFVQFGEIIINKWQAPDWTDKVDISIQDKISFRLSTYAQKNNLRYAADDTIAPQLGDGSFTVADEKLEFEKDLLTLPFAASPMVKRLNDISVPSILRWDVTNFEWMDGPPKILILDKTSFTPSFDYIDNGGGISAGSGVENIAYFILPGKADNLGFDNNLLSKHYADFIAMLDGYKKVTLAMKLTAVDIEALDFSIPIYLQQYAAYFFINKIEQWISGSESCMVELVKID